MAFKGSIMGNGLTFSVAGVCVQTGSDKEGKAGNVVMLSGNMQWGFSTLILAVNIELFAREQ